MATLLAPELVLMIGRKCEFCRPSLPAPDSTLRELMASRSRVRQTPSSGRHLGTTPCLHLHAASRGGRLVAAAASHHDCNLSPGPVSRGSAIASGQKDQGGSTLVMVCGGRDERGSPVIAIAL